MYRLNALGGEEEVESMYLDGCASSLLCIGWTLNNIVNSTRRSYGTVYPRFVTHSNTT
jgi:hypothetical protein